VKGAVADLEWSVNVEAVERSRILHGWTRRDLAQHASIDEGTLCDLVAGRRRPTFGTLRAICMALHLSLEEVIAFTREASQR
jgi:DNA-binding Xre family transcriptional regulator